MGMNYKIVSSGVLESGLGVLPETNQCGAVHLE